MKIEYSSTSGIGLLRKYKKGDYFYIGKNNYENLQSRHGYFVDLCLMERASKKWFADCTLHKEYVQKDGTNGSNPFDKIEKCYIVLGEEIYAKNEVDFFKKKAVQIFNPYDETIPF